MRTLEERRLATIRRSLLRARARDLSDRLDLPVVVTDFGWLGAEVEIEITRLRNGGISPVRVLVGHAATDLMVLDLRGRFRRYNQALQNLRRLARRLTHLAKVGHVVMRVGAPVVYTAATLSMLEELVAKRESVAMRGGAIRLKALDEEIALYTRHYELFRQVIQEAVSSAQRPQPQRGNA